MSNTLMMNATRTFRPRISGQATRPKSDAKPILRRNISLACTNCRIKKAKCDGEKPFCSRCRDLGQRCMYEVSDGRKKESWKSAVNDLQQQNAQLKAIVKALTYNASDDAAQRLQQLLEDPPQISHEKTARFEPTDPYSRSPSLSQSFSGTSPSKSSSNISPRSSVSSGSDTDISGEDYLDMPPESITRHAVSSFFGCGSTLFYIMPQEACEDILEATYEQPAYVTKSMVCQLCALALVGSQYSTDPIPSYARDRYLQNAYSLLQSGVADDDLAIMRAHACLAVYFILLKSTSARTITASGFNIARCNMHKYKQDASFADWSEWARLLRTLAFIEGWLSSTCRYKLDIRSDEIKVINDLAVSESVVNSTKEVNGNLIRFHALKIALLSAQDCNILHSVVPLSIDGLHYSSTKLDTWLWELPESMRLGALTSTNSTVPNSTRRPLIFLHMININSQLTLYERLIRVNSHQAAIPSDEAVVREILRWPADTHRKYEIFAQQLARMVRLLYDEDCVLARCWLTINACYHSSLVLMLSVVLHLASGFYQESIPQDLSHVRDCLLALRFCEDYDIAAMRLTDIVVPIHQRLEQIIQELYKADQAVSTHISEGSMVSTRLAHILFQLMAAMDLCYREIWV